MRVGYYIDPETGEPHLYKHDVAESEVEEILKSPGEDRSGRDGSRVAIGQTLSGRYLKVIYVPDEESESIFVVTAFDLDGKPLIAYRRRNRRRRS